MAGYGSGLAMPQVQSKREVEFFKEFGLDAPMEFVGENPSGNMIGVEKTTLFALEPERLKEDVLAQLQELYNSNRHFRADVDELRSKKEKFLNLESTTW